MATFDLSQSDADFNAVTVLSAATNLTSGVYSWLTTDPGNVITALGTGFTFDGLNRPTGGTVTSINFALADSNTSAGGTDGVLTGISVNLVDLFNFADPAAGQARFWELVLGGNDTITAPELAGGRVFGDFDAVLALGLDSVIKTGGDDTMVCNSSLVQGLLAVRGDSGAPNALIGDAVAVQGTAFGMFASFATVVGGNDSLSISGTSAYVADGDVQVVYDLGSATGGNDTITSALKYVSLLGFGRAAQYSGDVEINFGLVTGGDDTITGSSYAFANEILYGDVARNLGFGLTHGGADILSGRAGQEMIAGDVGTIGAGSRTEGGADLIRGGGDSDILAGDVLVFDLSEDDPVQATIVGGDDRIFGDAGDDWISGDVWEISNAAGNSAMTGGDDRLLGGDGDDQLFGDAGMVYTGLVTANFLIGGDDTLDGGLGNDLIDGQSGVDTAAFNTVDVAVIVNLTNGVATGQGSDTLANIENVIGSVRGDTIVGSTLANVLAGGGGNDSLVGRSGSDRLTGGGGKDTLAGGLDGDTFDYNALSESGITNATRDVITDWDADDVIDVSTIDANVTIAGNQAFALDLVGAVGTGKIGIAATASGILLQFNTDSDSEFEMVIEVQTALAITGSDFVF